MRVVKEPDFIIEGKVDYIVSGDKHLLLLGEFKGTKIVSVKEMLNIL